MQAPGQNCKRIVFLFSKGPSPEAIFVFVFAWDLGTWGYADVGKVAGDYGDDNAMCQSLATHQS